MAELLSYPAAAPGGCDEGRRLRRVKPARLAADVFGVHGSWASQERRPAISAAPVSPVTSKPPGTVAAACALLPGDAPWMQEALGSHRAPASGTPPVAAVLLARPGALALARPGPDGSPGVAAYLPIALSSSRPLTVAGISHSHVVFSTLGLRRPGDGPTVTVIDLARVPPGDFLRGPPATDSAADALLPSGPRTHKVISLVPRSLRGSPAPSLAVDDAAISSMCLLRSRAASALEPMPALAAVGTFGRSAMSNAVFILDLDAGASLRAMWGQPGGINTLSMTYTPAEERRLAARREARGEHGAEEGAPWAAWAAAVAPPAEEAADAWLEEHLAGVGEGPARRAATMGGTGRLDGAAGAGARPGERVPYGLVGQAVRPVERPEGSPGAVPGDVAAMLRGVVVAAGDRAGCVGVYRCDLGVPASLARVTSAQVLSVSVDGVSGCVAVLGWAEGDVRLLCGQTLRPLRTLVAGGVTKMDVDWDSGVMVTRGTQEVGEGPAEVRVRSLWHVERPGRGGGSEAGAEAGAESDAASDAEAAEGVEEARPESRVLHLQPPAVEGQATTGAIAVRGDVAAFTAHLAPGAAGSRALLCVSSVGLARAATEAGGGEASTCSVM